MYGLSRDVVNCPLDPTNIEDSAQNLICLVVLVFLVGLNASAMVEVSLVERPQHAAR